MIITSNKPIEAGVVSKLASKLSKSMKSFFNDISRFDMSEKEEKRKDSEDDESKDSDEAKQDTKEEKSPMIDRAVRFAVLPNGVNENTPVDKYPLIYQVMCTGKEEDEDGEGNKLQTGTFDFALRNRSKKKSKIVRKDNVEIDLSTEDAMNEAFDKSLKSLISKLTGNKVDGYVDVKPIASSGKVSAKLRKITADSGIDVQLVSVSAGCQEPLAAIAIADVVDDDEFLSQMPEGDTCYEIVIDPSGYDVNVCDESNIDMKEIFLTILPKLYQLRTTAEYLLSLCYDDSNLVNIRLGCDRIYDEASSEISWFLQISRSYLGVPVQLNEIFQNMSSEAFADPSDIRAQVEGMLDILNLYWCNFEYDDQQAIHKCIDIWKNEVQPSL